MGKDGKMGRWADGPSNMFQNVWGAPARIFDRGGEKGVAVARYRMWDTLPDAILSPIHHGYYVGMPIHHGIGYTV